MGKKKPSPRQRLDDLPIVLSDSFVREDEYPSLVSTYDFREKLNAWHRPIFVGLGDADAPVRTDKGRDIFEMNGRWISLPHETDYNDNIDRHGDLTLGYRIGAWARRKHATCFEVEAAIRHAAPPSERASVRETVLMVYGRHLQGLGWALKYWAEAKGFIAKAFLDQLGGLFRQFYQNGKDRYTGLSGFGFGFVCRGEFGGAGLIVFPAEAQKRLIMEHNAMRALKLFSEGRLPEIVGLDVAGSNLILKLDALKDHRVTLTFSVAIPPEMLGAPDHKPVRESLFLLWRGLRPDDPPDFLRSESSPQNAERKAAAEPTLEQQEEALVQYLSTRKTVPTNVEATLKTALSRHEVLKALDKKGRDRFIERFKRGKGWSRAWSKSRTLKKSRLSL